MGGPTKTLDVPDEPKLQKIMWNKAILFCIIWNMIKHYDNSVKYCEVSWQFNETLRSFFTIQWNIMKFFDNQMKYNEVSWSAIPVHDRWWHFMTIHHQLPFLVMDF